MAILILDPNLTPNVPRATYKAAANNIRYDRFIYASGRFDSTGWLNKFDATPASWSNGTGTTLFDGGAIIFTSEAEGGALRDVILANRGSQNIYYGLNDTVIADGSGSFMLATGESIQWSNAEITDIWAKNVDAGVTGEIHIQGIFGMIDQSRR